MPQLTCKIEQYSGWDGTVLLTVMRGETFECSDRKAAQLLSDFPGDFEAPKPKAPPRKPATIQKRGRAASSPKESS